MELSGTFTVSAQREDVYEFLTDPNSLVPALPDIKGYEIHDAENFDLKASVGVSHIRGIMKVKMRVAEKEPSEKAAFNGRAHGIGSNVDLKTGFQLSDASDGGTEVAWIGNARIGGRLASVAGGLLQPLAKKNINAFVNSVQQALESSGRHVMPQEAKT